jgi:hypothetical protein
MVDAQNKAARGRRRATASGNNIKTLLARRRAAQSYDIVAARYRPLRPRAALFCTSTIMTYEYNNAFLYFFTSQLLRAPSGGDAETITMDFK